MPLKKLFYLFFVILDLIALGIQTFVSINNIFDLYSYFTILSNVFAILMFIYLVYSPKPRFGYLRGAITLYMCITGIVYWILLSRGPNLAASPWINLVAHGAMPIAVFLSWIWTPVDKKLDYKKAVKWLIFPILFVPYTLIRGEIVGWYPYFFLDPNKVGYLGVLGYFIIILVGAYILSILLVKIANSRIRKNL